MHAVRRAAPPLRRPTRSRPARRDESAVDGATGRNAAAGGTGTRPWDPPPRRWLAAVASVLLGTAIAVSLWLAAPGRSLAADVVQHMAEEPDAWARTDIPVPESRLDKVLIDS